MLIYHISRKPKPKPKKEFSETHRGTTTSWYRPNHLIHSTYLTITITKRQLTIQFFTKLIRFSSDTIQYFSGGTPEPQKRKSRDDFVTYGSFEPMSQVDSEGVECLVWSDDTVSEQSSSRT